MLGYTKGFLNKFYSKLGVNQSWTDETLNRVNGVVYTNNENSPIMVNISLWHYSNNGVDDYIEVNGVQSNRTGTDNSSSYTELSSLSVIVPSGHTYKAVTLRTIDYWAELK